MCRRYPLPMKPDPVDPEAADHERLAIPLDPETALKALLAVDPEDKPSESDREPEPTDAERDDR
jgi:hypothetical protein